MSHRCACLVVVALLGPGAFAAEKSPEQLQRDLRSEDRSVRLAAAVALSSASRGDAEQLRIVVVLAEGLTDPDPRVRAESARATRNLGGEAGMTAIPRLLGALADRDAEVREQAAVTLGNFSARAGTIQTALRELQRHPDPGVRATAVGLLGTRRLGLREAAVPDLVNSLRDGDARVRQVAARGLWQAGPDARPAVTALAAAVHGDPDGTVRVTAVEALAAAGPEAVP